MRVHVRRFGADVRSSSRPTSGDTAGRVASFSGGVLTVRLHDGSQVSGRVADATEMECTSGTSSGSDQGDQGDQGDQSSSGSDQGSSGGDQGDQSSSGSDQGSSGDDQGDQSSSGSDQSSSGSDQGGDQGDQSSSGSDQSDQGDQTCSSSALAPGTVVQAAELKVSRDGATWDKLELDS